MNRLLISIIGLLSFCVAKADNLGYSPDGGLNLYVVCDNDTLNRCDPNGCIPLDTVWDIGNIIYDICVGKDMPWRKTHKSYLRVFADNGVWL